MSHDVRRNNIGLPVEQGLYDPANEHDACGFGFIANIHNEPKHEIVHQALEIVHNLDHRGAIGADPLAGDGAGILIQIPDEFMRKDFASRGITLPPLETTRLEWYSCQTIRRNPTWPQALSKRRSTRRGRC